MADSKRYYVSFDYSGPHDEYNTECIYSFDANGGIIVHDMHQYKHAIELEAHHDNRPTRSDLPDAG